MYDLNLLRKALSYLNSEEEKNKIPLEASKALP